MIRQDYIQRAIQQLARALALLAGQKKDPDEVLEVVQQAKSALPLVPGLVTQLSVAQISEALPHDAVVSLAQLLRHESKALQDLGRYQEAVAVSRRCLALLEQTSPPNETTKGEQPAALDREQVDAE